MSDTLHGVDAEETGTAAARGVEILDGRANQAEQQPSRHI